MSGKPMAKDIPQPMVGQIARVKAHELAAQNVNPGRWAISGGRPLSTLLGSCVAVCLHDPVTRQGGMNHFLLPSKKNDSSSDTEVVLAGDYAMEILVNALMKRGAARKRLVAKAFGGGNVLSAIRTAIGERNARFATEWLGREGIPLIASDFGGALSRKVVFVPHTGEAYCRRTPMSQALATVVAGELDCEKEMLAAGTREIDYF